MNLIKKNHAEIRFFAYLILVLPGLPAGYYSALYLMPDADQNTLFINMGISFALSYPSYAAMIWFLLASKHLQSFALMVTGILARMFGLGAVSLYFMLTNRALFGQAVLIYFSFIAAFLLFELVSIITILIYGLKYRLKDKDS
jgi:hypothetical protein